MRATQEILLELWNSKSLIFAPSQPFCPSTPVQEIIFKIQTCQTVGHVFGIRHEKQVIVDYLYWLKKNPY